MAFPDRRAAGRQLGAAVASFDPVKPVVLALPRGGVPVGFEVATALECDLDVLLVRKVGLPMQPELAMGAIGEGGAVVRNDDVISITGVGEEEFDRVVRRETGELERRRSLYRGDEPPADVEERTAVIVDDGLATGSTVEAGVRALRERGPVAVWVAVPVAPRDTAQRIGSMVDRLVLLKSPRVFRAVGVWYDDFSQTSDQEVRSLLAEARLR